MTGRRLDFVYNRQYHILDRHIFIRTLLLEHIKDTLLCGIHNLIQRFPVLITRVGNLLIDTNQSSQCCIITDGLGVMPDIGRCRHTADQFADKLYTGKFLRNIFHLQTFLERQHIYRFPLIVKFNHGIKKNAVLTLVKIISCDHLRSCHNGIRIHDHRTYDRFFRINTVGQNSLYNRLIHILCLLSASLLQAASRIDSACNKWFISYLLELFSKLLLL